MASDDAPQWSMGDPYSNLEAMANQDFSDLLNMDFNTYPGLDSNEGMYNDNDTTFSNGHQKFSGAEDAENAAAMQTLHSNSFPDAMAISSAAQDQHSYTQFTWPPNQHYPGHNSIPPTPNSSEMYPNQRFHQNTGAGLHYQDPRVYTHKDGSFTPLTSPQFLDHNASTTSIHDYAISQRQLMSPLTSPAIYAQGPHSTRDSLTADSSITGSPIDLEQSAESAFEERPRKTRKREPTAKQTQLALRKRKNSVASIKTATKLATQTGVLASRPASVQLASNAPSMSPQVQPDRSMPPPPLPTSARGSPYLYPASGSIPSNGHPPATPASLMRLAKQQQLQKSPDGRSPVEAESGSIDAEMLGMGMEELTLPEAAAPPSRSGSARATPAILPKVPVGTASVLPSPRGLPPNTSKNPAGRGGTSRKRNSTSSLLISPAIRPRISPNIQPMYSEGVRTAASIASEENTARLLESRSNYQNLVEGTTVPGMNYPLDLTTNLTSKRTSHKIAEQGRRNRINSALHEMHALLPASATTNGGSPNGDVSGSGSGSGEPKTPATPAQQANSKAATVEAAIGYIKSLLGQLSAKDAEFLEKLSAKDAEIQMKEEELQQLRELVKPAS